MNDSATLISSATTALFVPGDRPDRYERAYASGADFTIIDLEDAVSPVHKSSAREAVITALSAPATNHAAAVRINSTDDGGLDDARALAQLGHRMLAVMIPKAEHPQQLDAIADALGNGAPLIPLIETAAGLSSVTELASHPHVARIAFGAYDFASDIGSTSQTMLDHARCSIVVASRAMRVGSPLDSPTAEFRDLRIVADGARHARELGFGGQLCIHPAQVPVVRDAFRPSAAEVEWAHRILDADITGAGVVDGTMVDPPIQARARAILAQSTTAESR